MPEDNTKGPVSGTGHKQKKKRDWKAINAKRRTAVFAKAMGTTRYQGEQGAKLLRLVGEEFTDRMNREGLTIPDVFRILEERALSRITADQKVNYLADKERLKIRKHWKCILTAVEKICTINGDDDLRQSRLLKLAHILVQDDAFMGRVSGSGHD
jgi:hypothetical protein